MKYKLEVKIIRKLKHIDSAVFILESQGASVIIGSLFPALHGLSFLRTDQEIRICSAYSLWILKKIQYESNIVFANSLWIHYLFRESTLNPLFISRIYFEWAIRIASIMNPACLLKHYKLSIFTRIDYILTIPILSRIHYKCTAHSANWL